MELIDLVNSVTFFLSQMALLRWLIFLLGSLTVILTFMLFWIYLVLLMLVFVLQWLSLHWEIHAIVSVSIDFPINSKGDAPFHCIAYDWACADWDGVYDCLRDVRWEDIFKISASAAGSEFVSGFRLELRYISLIISIRSSLTHLYGFQLLFQLP